MNLKNPNPLVTLVYYSYSNYFCRPGSHPRERKKRLFYLRRIMQILPSKLGCLIERSLVIIDICNIRVQNSMQIYSIVVYELIPRKSRFRLLRWLAYRITDATHQPFRGLWYFKFLTNFSLLYFIGARSDKANEGTVPIKKFTNLEYPFSWREESVNHKYLAQCQ